MKTEKQLTAVEWLYNHLFPKQLDGFSHEEWNKIDLAFKQAKEMEEEHKHSEYMRGWKEGYKTTIKKSLK